MNNSTNAIIVLLIVTAGILGAIFLASYNASPAYAAEVSVKQGDYIMGTINFSPTRDLIYVIDLNKNKMNVYAANIRNKAIELVDSKIDLEKCLNVGNSKEKP